MPFFKSEKSNIYYEVFGEGHPILLMAPGGMESSIVRWQSAPLNLIELLQNRFMVVAMDQRNAGMSEGEVSGSDGWHTYLSDQLSLMDHIGADRFHVAGMCIGGAYAIGLARAAPERVSSAILMQPIGLDNNRHVFIHMFDEWVASIRHRWPEIDETEWESFRDNMFGGDFVFSVDQDFVKRCSTPILVLSGNDLYHPASVSEAVSTLAPNAFLIRHWKGVEALGAAARISGFLANGV